MFNKNLFSLLQYAVGNIGYIAMPLTEMSYLANI